MNFLGTLDERLRRRSRIPGLVIHWFLMTGVLFWILAVAWSRSCDRAAAAALLFCGVGMAILSVRLVRVFFPRASLFERVVVVTLGALIVGPLWILRFLPNLEFLVLPWGFSLLALLSALLLWFCRMGLNGSLDAEELQNTGRVLLVLFAVNLLGAGLLGWQIRDQPAMISLSDERMHALRDVDAKQRFEAARRAFANYAVAIPWNDTEGMMRFFEPAERDLAAHALMGRITWGFRSVGWVLPLSLLAALVAMGVWFGSVRRIRRWTVQGYFPRPKRKWKRWQATGKTWR